MRVPCQPPAPPAGTGSLSGSRLLPDPGSPDPGSPGTVSAASSRLLPDSGSPVSRLRPDSLAGTAEAIAAITAGLAYLNRIDPTMLTAGEQADCLRALERVEAGQITARSRILAAFTARGGYTDDGQHSVRAWLKWQTRITSGAAAGAVGWMKRLAAHPAIEQALTDGTISNSWARDICDWTGRLQERLRDDADAILLGAADGGATHADLAGLAEEIYRRCAPPDEDQDDGFDDRSVRLGITFRGAGRLDGDLTAGCSAALSAVLESLAKKAGPDDERTAVQRRHDALEEACHRLLASGLLPDRAGQPTQAQVHVSLDQLRRMPGASEAEAAWVAARAAEPGWLAGPAACGAACDATIVPMVTGHLDQAALDRITEVFLAAHGLAHAERAPSCDCSCGGCSCPQRQPLSAEQLARLRRSLLSMAADVLSGPGGLASCLRAATVEGQIISTASLPLDAGEAVPTIPAHLRRAVTIRDRQCSFPGCEQPPAACQVHHIVPREDGGPTTLSNLVLLCRFHHLIAIHRWRWKLTLHPDANVTVTSPDGRRTLRSHSPPASAA